MKDESKRVKGLAKFLCRQAGRDPDALRAGNVAFHSDFDVDQFLDGEYDHLFDAGGEYGPDGVMPNTDPGMFNWRDYVEKAMEIRQFLETESI